jgi:ureidoacrylate peracid hydrolase
MDPKTTAVVLIEYQNDFTSPGGALHDAVKAGMQSTNMLENTKETVERARKLGATIVHAPITFAPDYGEISPEPYGILKGVVDSNAFRKGTWGAEIVEDLKPAANDIVVEGKRGLDAFASTNLDFILRNRRITNVVLGGFLTNCCVESTMRTAYEKGYNVVTLKDCTATLSEDEQRLAVEKNYPMFSRPLNHEEFLAELGGKEEAAPAGSGRGYSS